MIYKNVKIYNFKEIDKNGEPLRLNEYGQLIHNKRKSVGVKVRLDKNINKEYLKTNNLEGDLIVLEHIAFLTNVKDQIVHKDIKIDVSRYPNYAEIIYYVYNTSNIYKNECCKREIKWENKFLTTNESEYKFKIDKKYADYLLNLSTTQNRIYPKPPVITEIKISPNGISFIGNDVKLLLKFWGTQKWGYSDYYENAKGSYLLEDTRSINIIEDFTETIIKETIIKEVVNKTETKYVPKLTLKDFAKSLGYIPDEYREWASDGWGRGMQARYRGGGSKSPWDEYRELKSKYGYEYEKYLKDKLNWHNVTKIDKDISKEVIKEIKHDDFSIKIITKTTYFNDNIINFEVLEKDFNIEKVNKEIKEYFAYKYPCNI